MNGVARIARLSVSVMVSAVAVASVACHAASGPQDELARNPAPLQADPVDLLWWQDAKFGLFIHWGPVSIKGTEIGWSRQADRPGRDPARGGIPAEEYDALYKQFNPVAFDADEWVALAKAAGMKYLVFTSKHHDGFSMFDTKLSDHNIMNSPFGRDVSAELAAASQRAGLKLGWYHSQPDWYHPDYRHPERHDRFIEFLHGQVRELCTNYGKVDIVWFDGLRGIAADWDAERLIRMIRTLQPGVLINNRAGLPADFSTPEQRIGRFELERPWESCITIGTQWAYKPDDETKSLAHCINMLVRTVGGGGNLLLNVGPMPNGQIDPDNAQRLREIGQWLKPIGESIYKTRGGPFLPGPWGATTHRDRNIYVHILNWIEPTIRLPALDARIVGSRLLTGGSVEVTQDTDGIAITVPPADRDPLDTIVVLTLDRPAAEANVATYRSGSLAFGRPVVAPAQKHLPPRDVEPPAWAVDDDYSTSWMSYGKPGEIALEVDLGRTQRIGRVTLAEGGFPRTKKFAVQYLQGQEWITAVEGGTIGDYVTLSFQPVEAQHVRLLILEMTDRAPLIAEFQVFEP
jgi:alpha-L-fucosidase